MSYSYNLSVKKNSKRFCSLCGMPAVYIRPSAPDYAGKNIKISYYCAACIRAGLAFGWLEPEEVRKI